MNIILLPENTPSSTLINDNHIIHHLQQVLTVKTGDTIKVGIKNGQLGTAIIGSISDACVELTQIHCDTMPPTKLPLTVILAIPRPKVLRRLVMDMTAMGVQKLILVNSYRSEKSYWQSPLLSKIDAYIVEGLQQGCDTMPLQVECQKRLKPFVEDTLPKLIHGKQAIIAHPYAERHFSQVYHAKMPTVLIIGAEGGFIDYEIELFKKVGCRPAHIGQRILRTETAVNVLCGTLLLAQR